MVSLVPVKISIRLMPAKLPKSGLT